MLIAGSGCFAQDSCFMRPTLEPLAITRNIDSIHLLLKDYCQSFTGCKGPEINCTGMEGTQVTPGMLSGKVTVLNFWFTHCVPCVAEFSSLNKLAQDYAGKDVRFISFALDKKAVLDTFLISHPLNYTIIPFSGDIDFFSGYHPIQPILSWIKTGTWCR